MKISPCYGGESETAVWRVVMDLGSLGEKLAKAALRASGTWVLWGSSLI